MNSIITEECEQTDVYSVYLDNLSICIELPGFEGTVPGRNNQPTDLIINLKTYDIYLNRVLYKIYIIYIILL